MRRQRALPFFATWRGLTLPISDSRTRASAQQRTVAKLSARFSSVALWCSCDDVALPSLRNRTLKFLVKADLLYQGRRVGNEQRTELQRLKASSSPCGCFAAKVCHAARHNHCVHAPAVQQLLRSARVWVELF